MEVTDEMLERLAQIILEHVVNGFRENKMIAKIELKEIMNNHSVDLETGEVRLHIPILEYDKKKYKKNKVIVPPIKERFQKDFGQRKELVNSYLGDAITEWELEFGIGTEVF